MNTPKALGVLAVLLFAAEAQARNPGILPPDQSFNGKTYSEWAAEWGKWDASIPWSTSPRMDTTGEWADLNQSGPVWFLSDAVLSILGRDRAVTRTVTIPEDTWLFIPVVRTGWTVFEVAGDPPWSPEERERVRGLIDAFVDRVDLLSCEIDGVSVTDLHAYDFATPDGGEYMETYPDDNFLVALGYDVPGFTYGPTIDRGVYLMVRPLSAGEHTVHFTSAVREPHRYAIDVTYELTVE